MGTRSRVWSRLLTLRACLFVGSRARGLLLGLFGGWCGGGSVDRVRACEPRLRAVCSWRLLPCLLETSWVLWKGGFREEVSKCQYRGLIEKGK
jgi:hypothetical protein